MPKKYQLTICIDKMNLEHQSLSLAWRIPWVEEPGGLPSMGSHRVGHDLSDVAAAAAVTVMSGSLPPDCLPLFTSLQKQPGLAVHGILQARILEWVAIPFSRRSSRRRDRTQVSRITGRFVCQNRLKSHIGKHFLPSHQENVK